MINPSNYVETSQLYSGIVYDTLRKMGLSDDQFLLSPKIRLIDSNTSIFAPIFTCSGRNVFSYENYDELDAIRYEIYSILEPGYAVVMSCSDLSVAHAGDITCKIYQKLKCRGLLLDGMVRDTPLIKSIDFPVACVSSTPIDALGRWAITEYQKPILIQSCSDKNIEINHNDMLFADADGSIIIKASMISLFLENLASEVNREKICREQIGNTSTEDLPDLINKLVNQFGRW